MKRIHLTRREQLLSALVFIVLVVGGYSLFRFLPANKAISELEKSAVKLERKLLKLRIPDQPEDDIDSLSKELAALKQEIELINEMSLNLKQGFAENDSQGLKLEISKLARDSDVFIRSNETMKVTKLISLPDKRKKRKSVKQTQAPLILPETAGWVARMSPGTLFYRPMQRIQLEGSFLSIRKFIHGLRDLSYQVTVLKIDINKSPNESPIGYSQNLITELVLAL